MSGYITLVNTVWLYPPVYVDAGLAATTYPYQRIGNIVICPDIIALKGVYGDIFGKTSIAQGSGNAGFSLGVGTNLQDMGEDFVFQLPGGVDIIRWRLVRQLTPQYPIYDIPTPGNSPNGTIGYVTVFTAWAANASPDSNVFDEMYVVRTG